MLQDQASIKGKVKHLVNVNQIGRRLKSDGGEGDRYVISYKLEMLLLVGVVNAQ